MTNQHYSTCNGREQQESQNIATEYCGWSDPCEGTTKENQTHSVPYMLISDQIVADGDGYKRQYTWRADPVCVKDMQLWMTAPHHC